MSKTQVTSKEYTGQTPRKKVTAAKATGNNLSTDNGGYFADGTTPGDNLTAAAVALEGALDTADANPNDLNRALAVEAETACNLKMDNAVLYVQGKVNAEPNAEIGKAIASAAALGVRKTNAKQPKPETVSDAGADYSGVPQTILVSIKKKPKYARYFEIWISLTPEVESSWTLKDTCGGKQLLVQGLSTGQKYFLRIVACNNTGKADPSEAYWAIAA